MTGEYFAIAISIFAIFAALAAGAPPITKPVAVRVRRRPNRPTTD